MDVNKDRNQVVGLVSGHVNDEILISNEYLAAENEILKSKLKGKVRFDNAERISVLVSKWCQQNARVYICIH